MKVSIIASGSNGNCTIVEHGNATLMIDAGLSCREIEKRLGRSSLSLENLDAVLLTHSHSDHARGAGVVSRKFNVPVYALKDTYKECQCSIGPEKHKPLTIGQEFMINGITVRPIETSHSVPSCGFVIDKFGIITDTGCITEHMKKTLPKLNQILIESNHDEEMVRNGSYPAFLKKWILSNEGHLSNPDADKFIQEHGENLSHVFLGHISENNNTASKAIESFENIVKRKVEYKLCSRKEYTGSWDF
jgi:phosphoribosyl 1,2-cyclic phosphodiesterase